MFNSLSLALMRSRYRRADSTCHCRTNTVLIGAGQDYNNHFHFLSIFHETDRINSTALYKIRIPEADMVPAYLYIMWIPLELHSHIEVLVCDLWAVRICSCSEQLVTHQIGCEVTKGKAWCAKVLKISSVEALYWIFSYIKLASTDHLMYGFTVSPSTFSLLKYLNNCGMDCNVILCSRTWPLSTLEILSLLLNSHRHLWCRVKYPEKYWVDSYEI